MSYKQYNNYNEQSKQSLVIARLDDAKTAIENMPSGGSEYPFGGQDPVFYHKAKLSFRELGITDDVKAQLAAGETPSSIKLSDTPFFDTAFVYPTETYTFTLQEGYSYVELRRYSIIFNYTTDSITNAFMGPVSSITSEAFGVGTVPTAWSTTSTGTDINTSSSERATYSYCWTGSKYDVMAQSSTFASLDTTTYAPFLIDSAVMPIVSTTASPVKEEDGNYTKQITVYKESNSSSAKRGTIMFETPADTGNAKMSAEAWGVVDLDNSYIQTMTYWGVVKNSDNLAMVYV